MAAIGTLPVLFATGIHASRPAASAVGKGGLYSCTTHSLVYQTDGSSWTTWATLGSTGSVATDTIWDAKGDLAAGTGADTAAKRTVGADDTILMADSAQTTGLKWVASQTPSTQAFSDSAAQGTADTYARGDHKHGMPASPGGGSLSYQQNQLSSDVTVNVVNTFVDGPAVTLSAGTWLLIANGLMLDPTGNGGVMTLKLWDGTTVLAHTQNAMTGAAQWYGPKGVSGVVVIASGTPTWKLSFTQNSGTGLKMKAVGDTNVSGVGNTGSTLSAIQIA